MEASKKILIIDDDSSIGEMMQTVLEFQGYEVEISEKPGKAEELILENKADLLILDMLISGINGTDICRKIRKNEDPRISGIPILMMSALHEANIKCKKAGASDFIAKPFEVDQLILKVEDLLNQ